MKKYIKILFVLLLFPLLTVAQEEENKDEKVKEKLERPAFESAMLIDNPTNVLFGKNALEVQMQHRFGLISEENSLAGIYGDGANIRIAVSYALFERLTIGYGTTKNQRLQDVNWKVALLRQTRSNSMPLSVTYYGNFIMDARKPDGRFYYLQHRWSHFNQLIIAKRFSPNVSLQIAPSVSHYNMVEKGLENDMVGIAFGGRIKISPQTSIIFDYSQPLSKITIDEYKPEAGYSLGVEFATSAHAFQIFATNLNGIVPQQNYMQNQNDFFNGDILIGFNITRVYNF